jgi:3'(2'), 5'-bisphosphate nucleotidase
MVAFADLPGSKGELGRELVTALELARAAGAVVMKLRNGELDVELKPGDEPVTIADRRSSELIVAGLRAAFPDDPLISEELAPAPGALGAERLWLIDPIDGTKDFIRGDEGFSIMIGLMRGGRPTLGVVHQPAAGAPGGRTFFATPDGGAFAYVGDQVAPLAVSDTASAGAARLVASKSHRSDTMEQLKATLGITDEMNVGSVGVKLSLIALGVRDLYISPVSKTKAWDSCAPEAILTRAGGRLSDVFGAPIDYTQLGHPRGMVASTGKLHDEVIAKIAPLFSSMRS